ncbi:MAG: N-acetylmuramoyl-L-alanine amidase [Alphaproteobacteria bacterium]
MNSFDVSFINIKNDCFKKFDGNRQIDFLIFHHLQCGNVNQALEALEYHGVSAHFAIADDGEIIQFVDENDIAFHAGFSYFAGYEGLNTNSIGVEFLNKDPLENNFTLAQLQSGLRLANYLKNKYQISDRFILGHSDIAYDAQSNFLNRKQDPSYLFDWEFFSINGIGLYPAFENDDEFDELCFEYGDKDPQILEIKQKLANFGYKVNNFNENFDEEMQNLAIVFNRHYNNISEIQNQNLWLKASDFALNYLVELI